VCSLLLHTGKALSSMFFVSLLTVFSLLGSQAVALQQLDSSTAENRAGGWTALLSSPIRNMTRRVLGADGFDGKRDHPRPSYDHNVADQPALVADGGRELSERQAPIFGDRHHGFSPRLQDAYQVRLSCCHLDDTFTEVFHLRSHDECSSCFIL
jgi:hypothetical protein